MRTRRQLRSLRYPRLRRRSFPARGPKLSILTNHIADGLATCTYLSLLLTPLLGWSCLSQVRSSSSTTSKSRQVRSAYYKQTLARGLCMLSCFSYSRAPFQLLVPCVASVDPGLQLESPSHPKRWEIGTLATRQTCSYLLASW